MILRRFAPLFAAFLFLCLLGPAFGQTPTPPANALEPADAATLAAGQQTLGKIDAQAPHLTSDSQLAALQNTAASVEAQARAVLRKQTAQEAVIAAELKKIHPPGRATRSLTAAERAAEAPLLKQRTAVEAAARQAQSVANAASASYAEIAQQRRESFSNRFLRRAQSPMFPAFWTAASADIGPDLNRLSEFGGRLQDAALNADEPNGLIGLAAGLVIALLLVFPARRLLEHLGRRKSGESVHPGFARTAAAVWIVAVDTAMPTLATLAIRLGAQWGGLLSDEADALGAAAIAAVAWASATLALGRVLATDPDANHHILPVSATTGRRLRAPIMALALVTAGGLMLNRLNFVIGASVSASVTTDCLIALAYVFVAGLVLTTFGRDGPADDAGAPAVDRSPLWTLVSLLLAVVIVITLAALLTGYTTLAALTASQIFWLGAIAAITFLLLRFIDDLCAASFGQRGWAAVTLHALFNLRRTTIEQTGVLLAAALELFLVVAALRLALTPFGQGGSSLFSHFGQLGGTIQIGAVTLSPGAVIAGLATLAIGMLLVRGVRTWVVRRYLPVTEWDAGLRNSVTTGVVYLGAGIALICALSAMGLGFQQIALVASALSVGIGFGLQQIVQNFVSGIIVLIERPVKVGDWINVDGIDGDVRRIRVRATEIQTFDKATVIVPNSDLITKQVTNKTHGERTARIALKLSIGNPDDAERAAALIIEIAKAQPKTLKEPEPVVFIESLAAAGAVNFDVYVYVESARDVKRTRSDLYFEILKGFKGEKISFLGAAGPTNVVIEPGPDMRTLLTAAKPDAAAGPSTRNDQPPPSPD